MGGCSIIRIYPLAMNFIARLIDNNDCKIVITERVFVAEPPSKLFAMLDRTCSGKNL